MRISDWSSDVCSSDLPDELVDGVGALVEAEFGHGEVERLHGLHRLADDPAVDRQRGGGRLDMRARGDAVRLSETCRVPQLGREVAIALDALLPELDIAALAFHPCQREAHRIGALSVGTFPRIDPIALTSDVHTPALQSLTR